MTASSTLFAFELCRLPESTRALRAEVRAFLAERLAQSPPAQRALTWMGWDREFSRAVGARGWIGMTWPKRYGGGERSALERYVVLEEMLAAGAPVGAHWVADRQSGPLLLRYGSEEQRQGLLPRICRGELSFCIGMSEPDSGSDLASIRARAVRGARGWTLSGTKVWTSGARSADYMIGLFRTGADPADRHAGLSHFLLDLRTPGIAIRPIRDLTGNDHFCEVSFQEALVASDALLGQEGAGWAQVTAELAFERSGPERFLSCHPLLVELIRRLERDAGEREAAALGRLVAELATLRAMSISVAGLLEAGRNPMLEACLVKDVGGAFEQALPGLAQWMVDCEPRTDAGASEYQQVLGHLLQLAPSFSLRGGTREILRGIIARGLGLR
jgi:alkylation response protein AidB-like acyl-CoA dehydrogenase